MRDSLRISCVSNIVIEPFLHASIMNAFAEEGIRIKQNYIRFEEYSQHVDELYSAEYIIVVLNFNTLYPNAANDITIGTVSERDIMIDAVSKCQMLYYELKAQTNATIIWFGFEDYFSKNDILCGLIPAVNGLVDKINLNLADIFSDVVYIDLKRLIAKLGIYGSYSVSGNYRWNAPYSKELIAIMAHEVYKQYLIKRGSSKKCIVLDCDNVLWGGILSEDGIEGIRLGNSGLGKEYQDFQRFLLTLYYHGVILAVCSKNDLEDVLRVFNEHSGMLLQEDHIAYFCCNWNNKPENIKMISEKLNIGLDSVVFVDDSRFELEAVRTILPNIKAILYHRETVYSELSCFNLKEGGSITSINQRTKTYKTNIEREKLQAESKSFDDYISSLNMVLTINKTLAHEVSRISELSQRTNKCTNGKRYTLEQMREKCSSPEYQLYTVVLSDKFSDLGIVGAIGICDRTIDLFSLSCRALGRKVEDNMLRYAIESGANRISFLGTQKNADFLRIVEAYGLMIENEN